jgi:hypothetical protein
MPAALETAPRHGAAQALHDGGGDDADRPAAREEGRSAERRGRPVQRTVRDLGRAGDGRDGLGQLRAAAGCIGARGRSFSRKVVVPKGEPSNFLTEAELRGKFTGLADAVLGAERAGRLADAVLAIDATAKIASLARAASPMPARLARE